MFALMLVTLIGLIPGERLDYEVRLGPISVGSLELLTLEPDTVQGERCRHFQATLDISLRFLFRGRYVLESWTRYDDLVTLRSGKTTTETRYQGQWTADYRYDDSLVKYSDGDSFALENEARDLLTTWFYLRSLELTTGDTARFHVHSDRRGQDVIIVAHQKTEVETPYGKFRALELAQHGGGIVGRMMLSDDEHRWPVTIRTTISGLPLTVQLRSVNGGEQR